MPETLTATRPETVPPQILPFAAGPLTDPHTDPLTGPLADHAQAPGAPPRSGSCHAPPVRAHHGAPQRRPRHPRSACAPAQGGGSELAARFALRLVEVLTGVRPAGQLTRHTTHDGYRQLAHLVHGGPLRRRTGGARPLLGPVHDYAPGPGALEVCVRVEFGPRHHMVAFRLEQHRGTEQWQCAAVDAR
ncbi:Rv3235 family protein [Kitasatospora mediocidica]|uniref:Rv3235 family protein n=1 Tax=Kitasatospora mediocidica TaxID=58352 RepID=UPI000691EDCB|nr:Rv3235 family protein [Kitasatospora mediocidica]